MRVLSIKVPIRKKSGNLFNDLRSKRLERKLFYFVVMIQRRHKAARFWGEGKGADLL